MSKGHLTDIGEGFVQQGQEYLRDIAVLILELEGEILVLTDPARGAGGLQRLARHVHSIKGSAGSYGYDLISSICHNFEDRITAIRLDTKDLERHVDGLLRYIDHLRTAVQAYIHHNTETLDWLRSLLAAKVPNTTDTSKNAAQSPTRKRVLVIEKMGSLLLLINHALKHYDADGVDIAIAHDAYEGLGRLLKERFDCVIMSNISDWLTGTALLTLLSDTLSPNQKTPFVLLTSTENLALPRSQMPVVVLTKNADLSQLLLKNLVKFLGVAKKADSSIECFYHDILLVDDSVFIHRLVRMALRRVTNIQLRCVSSGPEALEALRQSKPDLMLLDFQMPDMDGLEFAALLKSNKEGFSNIPFAFLTGATNDTDQALLSAAKPLSIIKKPFPPMDLPNILNALHKGAKTTSKAS